MGPGEGGDNWRQVVSYRSLGTVSDQGPAASDCFIRVSAGHCSAGSLFSALRHNGDKCSEWQASSAPHNVSQTRDEQ